MTRILDGKRIASVIHDGVQVETAQLAEKGTVFTLSVILVGENPASESYVKGKQRDAGKVGIHSELIRFPDTISQETLFAEIDRLNADEKVDGILVQLPLPGHLSEREILERIRPDKDVDGFHPLNVGRNFSGIQAVWPCTPAGVMEMLRIEGIDVAGKHAVVVGRSNIVGKPMAMLLLQANATVTICHSRTPNMEEITRQADILVVAVGKANLIGAKHIKPGAVVIDVGMNRVDDKLTGDVAFEEASTVASAITPVPGGVGLLTRAMLMVNTVHLGKARRGLGG